LLYQRVNGRVNLQRAINWCLSNPITEKASAFSAKDVEDIIGMGFSRAHAERGLKLKKNKQDAALWCAMNPDTSKSGRKPNSSSSKDAKYSSVSSNSAPKAKPKLSRNMQARVDLESSDSAEKKAARMEKYKALEEQIDKQTKQLGSKKVDSKKSKNIMANNMRKKKEIGDKAKFDTKSWDATKRESSKNNNEIIQRTARRKEEELKIKGLDNAVKHLQENYPAERVTETLSLILKIVNKVLKEPNELKYRKINLLNKRIQKAIVRPLGAMVIMKEFGFTQKDESTLIMSASSTASFKSKLKKLERALDRSATMIPTFLQKAETQGASKESLLYCCLELKRVLTSIAELPSSVPLRSLSTEQGSIYSLRFAPFREIVSMLKYLGFESTDGRRFIRMNKPDVAFIWDALKDFDKEIHKRKPLTGVAHAVAKLLNKRGQSDSTYVIDKARVCLSRVAGANEAKNWEIDVKRLFKSRAGVIPEAEMLFKSLGFLQVGNGKVKFNGEDTNGASHSLQHLNEMWRGALTMMTK